MAVLDKATLEAQKRSRIRSNGQGGLTQAEDLRAYEQHVLDTMFSLADKSALENAIQNLNDQFSVLERIFGCTDDTSWVE